MEIKLLKDEYINSNQIYIDFLNNKINNNEDHFTDEIIKLNNAPVFPIYMHYDSKKRMKLYLEAFNTISEYYLKLDRKIQLEGRFWYSLLCTEMREYLIENYPEILESEKVFRNIVLKKFDWENYIYKCILGAQYICDNIPEEDRKKYFELIINNLDIYNYIIKYSIFRNDKFLINILDIVYYNDLSKILKAKVKGRTDLGSDERVGRRVIYEMNKSYPIILSPMLDKEELEDFFISNLEKYIS
jgi:hypothetical protein